MFNQSSAAVPNRELVGETRIPIKNAATSIFSEQYLRSRPSPLFSIVTEHHRYR
jgi:hypothetical protein